MKKYVLTYGTIAGSIVASMMLGTIYMMADKNSLDYGQLYGYIGMLTAFSMIFFGIAQFRKSLGGQITFGKAFLTGLFISLIASAFYLVSWEIYYQQHGNEFIETYSRLSIEKMQDEGASPEALKASAEQMDSMMTMYRNPLFRYVMTLLEILPVGLLISLIAALILKKKSKS